MTHSVVTTTSLSSKATAGNGTTVDVSRSERITEIASAVVSGGSAVTTTLSLAVDTIWVDKTAFTRNTAATHKFSQTVLNFGYSSARSVTSTVSGTVAVTTTINQKPFVNTVGKKKQVATHTTLSAAAEATTGTSVDITSVDRCVAASSVTLSSGDVVTITTEVYIGGTWHVLDITTYTGVTGEKTKGVEFINDIGATAIRVNTSAYTQTPAVTAKVGVVAA